MRELRRNFYRLCLFFKPERQTQNVCLILHRIAFLVDFPSATGHNNQMIQLLQDLRGQLSEGAQNRVDELLASVCISLAALAESLTDFRLWKI